MRLLVVWLLLTGVAFADDVVVCDPTASAVPNAVTRFDRSTDSTALRGRTGFLIWEAPYASMTPERVAEVNRLRGQLDALSGVPVRYWKCADLTLPVDGITESVVEMSLAEKNAVDAPAVAQQGLVDEYVALSNQLDADDANWSSLTTAQKLAVAKKLLRREVLQRRLGE